MPGTSPTTVITLWVTFQPPLALSNVTSAFTFSLVAGVPFLASRAENAIEKHAPWAEARSSSGEVLPLCGPVRAAHETGIRENTLRMHAVGAPVRGRLVLCYSLSAAIAGVAGGIWAQANAYVNLGTLGLDRAATVLIILVLGGYSRLYGAFIGAVAYMVLSHFLSKIYPTAWQLGLGLLLVVIALFARNGILGIAEAAVRRLGTRQATL